MECIYYSQEKVDQYLQAIRDGKIDVKDILEVKRMLYDYSEVEKTPDGKAYIGPAPYNPHYLACYMAIGCHTVAGSGMALIVPDDRIGMKNGTI